MIHEEILPAIQQRIREELTRRTYPSTIVMILRKEFNILASESIPLIKEMRNELGRNSIW